MFLALLSLVLAQLQVEGDATCPQPADVSARFAQLAPNQGGAHRARLAQSHEREVELTLLDATGAVIAHRTLTSSTCHGLLEASAATLFAWEATFPQRAQPESPVARVPLQAGVDTGAAPLLAESPVGWRVELGLLAAFSGRAVSPGAALAVLVGPRRGLWFGRLSVKAATPFSAALAGGRVEWLRPSVGLGPVFRLVDAAVRVEAGASFEAGVVAARGIGFEDDRGARGFDPAIGLSARGSRELTTQLGLFAELAASFFLLPQVAQVAGIQVNFLLPPVTFELRAGISWGT